MSLLMTVRKPIWHVHTCTDIPATEEYALRWLYWHTRGASWTNKTNWLTSSTAGNWYGVTVASGHVTGISLSTNNLVGSITDWQLGAFPALNNIVVYSNASLSGALSLSILSAPFQWLSAGNTGLLFTGTLSNLPASMQLLAVNNTASVITGALSNLPALLWYLDLSNTPSIITGGAVTMAAIGINTLNLNNIALTQANVDSVVLTRLYADRALFTAAAPVLNIGGTNSAPTGIYQSVTPPTSGKEAIYDLVNDPTAQGFKKWAITFTP